MSIFPFIPNLHFAATGVQQQPRPPPMATVPTYGLRRLNSGRPWMQSFRRSSILSSAIPVIQDSEESQFDSPKPKTQSYFPKRGQTLELVCESLAFKGKGLCKVADTGFVVLCDRALPGERFVGRVTRKKGNYAEVRWNRWLLVPRLFSVWFLRKLRKGVESSILKSRIYGENIAGGFLSYVRLFLLFSFCLVAEKFMCYGNEVWILCVLGVLSIMRRIPSNWPKQLQL